MIEEMSPAQRIQGVVLFHGLSDRVRIYDSERGLPSVLATRAEAALGIKGPRGA
ncbi:MAG: hypothetical protein ACR5LG_02935 [Sodalis sp. (in: enterobacteria)]|uniref:hypothetical protein n=1 Tax=Sodalis sp. (in: enterobacteria) TaxID=1898979 RepID=UPI003F2C83C9